MKHRLLIVALALLLLNFVFFFVVILPARRTVRAHAAAVQDLQVRLQSLRHEQRQQQVLESLVKRMDQFRNGIPPHGAIIQMIRRVMDQARQLHLSVPSVTYQPVEVTEDPLVKLGVHMEVGGNYAAIRRFLYEVEGLQHPLVIEKLVLTSGQEMGRLSLRLEMAAYFLDEGGNEVNRQVKKGRL